MGRAPPNAPPCGCGSAGGLPGVACWLLRRSVDGSELRCSLSNAPETTGRPTLGRVGATRWCIETDIQTTTARSGWMTVRSCITASLRAGACLVQVQQDWGTTMPAITRVLREVRPNQAWTVADLRAWLVDARTRTARAEQSHTKRRAGRAAGSAPASAWKRRCSARELA